MKTLYRLLGLTLFVLFYHNAAAQSPIHPDSSFYNFLDSFYLYNSDDGTEAGIYNQVRRDAFVWGQRLAPSGDMRIANSAMVEYARKYNQSLNLSASLPPVGTPSPLPPIHPSSNSWKDLGPHDAPNWNNGVGQIHRIDFHPNYGQGGNKTLYAGTHFGGLYRSLDGGLNWQNWGTDRGLPLTSIGGVAVSKTNPDTVFVCTGNADHGYVFGFEAPYDPLRGGVSGVNPLHTVGVYMYNPNSAYTYGWEPINGIGPDAVTMIDSSKKDDLLDVFATGGTMRNILLHPQSDSILFIATSQGIFRTTDYGTNWTQVLIGPDSVTLDPEWRGLEFHPVDPNIIYASGRDIYKSTDGGITWTSMTANTNLTLPVNANYANIRINIAVTPANPNYVIAYIVGNSPIFHTEAYIYLFDGNSWVQKYIETPGNSTDYKTNWLGIAVSPLSADTVYLGRLKIMGTNNFLSSSPSFVDNSGVHDDVHEVVYTPDGKQLFVGTHGGVSEKLGSNIDTTTDWRYRYNGLGVATVWAFDDWEGNDSLIVLGHQDIGSNATINMGVSWKKHLGGDGYGARIDDQTGDWYIRGNASGHFKRAIMNPSHLTNTPASVAENTDLPSNTIVPTTFPAVNHPKNDSLYFGFTELYLRKSDLPYDSIVSTKVYSGSMLPGNLPLNQSNCETYRVIGDTAFIGNWTSPVGLGADYCDLQITYGLKEKWTPESDIYQYQAVPDNRRILELAFSEDDSTDYTYMATLGDNSVNRRSDFYFNDKAIHCDTCFVKRTDSIPISTNFPTSDPNPITDIAVDPQNGNRVWISLSGFDQNLKVLYSDDAGLTWQSYDDSQGSLASLNMPINNIAYQRNTKDRLYIATDVGIYVREDGGDWMRLGDDFPNVRTVELKINYCSGKLRAATFGRGAWEADLLPPEEDITHRSFRTINTDEVWNEDKHLSRTSLSRLAIHSNSIT